jgi:glycosyltransferase involved in cell wall biosynthesis
MSSALDVTVVIPMFNAHRTIARALESVASQTRQPAAVIVVDDASTDGSAVRVKQMALPNTRVVQLEANRGAGHARNVGARMAKTDWIAFLDADDVWDAQFLETLTASAIALGVDFVSSGGVRRNLRTGETFVRLTCGPFVARDRTPDFWRMAMRFVPAHPSATVVSRAAFHRVGGFPTRYRYCEDWVLWSRLWVDGRFAFVNKPLSSWLLTESGLTASGSSLSDELRAMSAIANSLLRAMRERRPGTSWFLLWYCRTFARRGLRSALRDLNRCWAGGLRLRA